MGADDEVAPQGGTEMTGEAPTGIFPGLYDVDTPQVFPTKRGRGQPRKTIDYEQAGLLARKMCTYDEIAIELGVSRSWLERDHRFREVYSKARNGRKIGLRDHQFRTAEGGNVLMQIHLGKYYLDQRDKDGDRMPVVIVIDKKDSAA